MGVKIDYHHIGLRPLVVIVVHVVAKNLYLQSSMPVRPG
jgi:hypothetical protein